MRKHSPSVPQFVNRVSTNLLKKTPGRKLICLALVLNLLIWPGHVSSLQPITVLGAVMGNFVTSLNVEFLRMSTDVLKSWFGSTKRLQRVDTLADRLSAVGHIQVSPAKYVGYEGEVLRFAAVATDGLDRAIQGVKFTWESADAKNLQIDDTGQATLLQAGVARIICRAGSVLSDITVVIKPGPRPVQTDEQWRADQASLKAGGAVQGASGSGFLAMLYSAAESLLPAAYAQVNGPPTTDIGYNELWSDPANLVGHPGNRAVEAARVGSVLPEGSNFNLAIPIISRAGRGINLNLTLYYNSRVWSRRGSAVTFDAVASWPAPGFSLGFGRIVTYDVVNGSPQSCKYMLVDPDGTRHYLGQGNPQANVTYQTSDGTHITYVGSMVSGGVVFYNNGSRIHYRNINNRLLPEMIHDSNGNYIVIAYKPGLDPETGMPGVYGPAAIDYIIDTLGRVFQFNYDESGKLTSIAAPGFGGTAQNPVTQTIAQFDYQNVSVTGSFSGLTVENRPAQPVRSLRHVFFPATSTGYLFSYSAFGMIYNYSIRRQMSASGSPPAIQDGVESANVSFNYPVQSTPALTAPPKFTQRTETAVNAPTSVYTYATNPDDTIGQTRTFVITQPDASTVSLSRSINSASVANGLLVQAEIKNSSGASFAKSIFSYVLDGGGSPQVQSVTRYDDATPANQVKSDCDYDQYGNVTNKREYGFRVDGNWQVRRRTRIVYKTDSSYLNAHLRSLPVEVDLYDAQQDTNDSNDVLIAKSVYAYDNYVAMGGMEDYQGAANPPGYHPAYNASVTLRGNRTGSSEYSDLATSATITRLVKYDIFGNVVKAQVSCCLEKDLTNKEDTYWSQPQEVMSGDPAHEHETTSIDYDFNTSLARSKTDAAGLQANFVYDGALSLNSVSLPTGASAQGGYNYGSLSSSSTVGYFDGDVFKSITSTAQYDGWGREIRTVGANNAQVNTTYNNMGQVINQTNPFAAGGQPGSGTSFQYDTLGRPKITTLPDGNTVRSDYSGSSVTATDQVGRKIKRESDGLGRLTKVTEQDSLGLLSQETDYSYNLLDKLVLVNQGNQTRSYKYDALGRLLYERIPEQAATIDDGEGVTWTTKYTYTEFNAVQTKQDARGVVTTYGYDSLHRVGSIVYNTANAAGVAQTPTVSISYTASGNINQVDVGGLFTEAYSYDQYDRVKSVKRWMLGGAYNFWKTYTTRYEYNDGSQLKKITYPSGTTINLAYDNIGRLSSMPYDPENLWQSGFISNLSYNLAGQVTAMRLGNGVTESYDYDSQRLQLTRQTATRNGTPIIDLTYGHQAQAGQMGPGTTAGNAGQMMSIMGTINGTTESASYTYDLLGRLATSNQTSNGVSAARRFAYDRWGNRTGVWNAASGGNKIQSVAMELLENYKAVPTNRIATVASNNTDSFYTYDEAGNVTNDGQHTYQYDAENRLVSIDGGPTLYRYDHQNRRVGELVGGVWMSYIWEGNQVIAEHDTSTTLTSPSDTTYPFRSVRLEYIYSGSRLLNSTQYTWAGQSRQATSRYYLSDRLSTRVVMDPSGNVIGRQGHLPFGEDFAQSGTQEKHHFTSYERDAESGTDYALNRQYAQGVGRFMRTDPYAGSTKQHWPQSFNRYSYAGNDPINSVDPLGLICIRVPLWGVEGGITICTPNNRDEPLVVPEIDDSPGGPGPGEGQKPEEQLKKEFTDCVNSRKKEAQDSATVIKEEHDKYLKELFGVNDSNVASLLVPAALRAFDAFLTEWSGVAITAKVIIKVLRGANLWRALKDLSFVLLARFVWNSIGYLNDMGDLASKYVKEWEKCYVDYKNQGGANYYPYPSPRGGIPWQ